jgi:hypothetical protein
MCDVGTMVNVSGAQFGRLVIHFSEICRGLHLCVQPCLLLVVATGLVLMFW